MLASVENLGSPERREKIVGNDKYSTSVLGEKAIEISGVRGLE